MRPRVRPHTWTKDGTCEGTGRSRHSVASSAWAQARSLPGATKDTHSKPRRNGTQRLLYRNKTATRNQTTTNLAGKPTNRTIPAAVLLSGEDLVQFATLIELIWQHNALTHGDQEHHTDWLRTRLVQTRLGEGMDMPQGWCMWGVFAAVRGWDEMTHYDMCYICNSLRDHGLARQKQQQLRQLQMHLYEAKIGRASCRC